MSVSYVGNNLLIKQHDKITPVLCFAECMEKFKYFGMELRPKRKTDNAKNKNIIIIGECAIIELNIYEVAQVHKVKAFKECEILRIINPVGIKCVNEALRKSRK